MQELSRWIRRRECELTETLADACDYRRTPTSCSGAQGFAEADIQSLKEAVALSRQEAVEALRHSAGDLRDAFLNELGALHLNTPLLDDLVMSYAAQRCAELCCPPLVVARCACCSI